MNRTRHCHFIDEQVPLIDSVKHYLADEMFNRIASINIFC